MGHIRLGPLPRTRRWDEVVAFIASGGTAAQVAQATIRAAEKVLSRAANDPGVIETIWLLTKLPFAAKADNFEASLRLCGVSVTSQSGLIEIITAFNEAIDKKLPNNRGRTDLGEIAQTAAVETLSRFVGEKASTIFGTKPEDVRFALAKLATVKQFSSFAGDYFTRFIQKSLGYFLSRALPSQTGPGRRFATIAQQAEFRTALATHCREAALIVERFSGEWFSKANWESEGAISRDAIAKFTGGAMAKIVAELKQGAGVDD